MHVFLLGGEENPKEAMKALVVDADPKTVQELGAALRRQGWMPLEATTFEAAKRLWVAEHPPMLIADIRLGEFNGLQLLLRAKADRPDVAAVITCPVPDKVLEAETQRFGGTFLVKPVTPDEVLATVFRSLPQSFHSPVDDGPPAQSVATERRVAERRQLIIPGFSPERRVADRRRARPGR